MEKGQEPDFILNEDGEIGAVNLSSDCCTEHESGIGGIRTHLGIKAGTDKNNLGIKSRTITIFNPRHFFFEKGKTHACLTFEPEAAKMRGWRNYGLNKSPKEIASAWDDSSFGIVVENRYQKFLEDLYEAFQKKDVAVYFGESRFLMPHGLIIAIVSRIPEAVKKGMYKIDESRFRLEEEMKKTGIREKLKEAGKIYYSLNPRWKDDSETEIMFHLNPQDQENDREGYFTLQDLIDWTEDKGPIPYRRTKEQRC